MNPLGVITGLAAEARCLDVFPADQRPSVRVGGARTDRAGALCRELIAAGCRGLVSFGIAGGLADGLPAGAVVIARSVTAGGREWPADEGWQTRLLDSLSAAADVRVGAVAGADAVVAGPAAKRALAAETGALTVDMESHAVAEAALDAGLPFAVVRAVSDPASRALPAWVPGTIGEDGRTRMGAVVAGVLGHPLDLADLIGLWGENRRAFGALRRVAFCAGPAFRFE